MFAEYVEAGGPVMFAVLGTWIVVLAGVMDRLLYALGRIGRRPLRNARALRAGGDAEQARRLVGDERVRAERGLSRIDAVSKLATSIGLFGTVLGIAESFFRRGSDLELAAPAVLAHGLSTALFTTLGGLVVFLFGQGFLIAFDEWLAWCEGAELTPEAPR